MELKIEGVIKRILKPQEFDSGFRKCEMHIETTGDKYPQIIPLEFLKDMVDEAISLEPGQTIKANCNVNGREWRATKDFEGNILPEPGPWTAFLSLSVWKYEIVESSIKEQVQAKAASNTSEGAKDLPF